MGSCQHWNVSPEILPPLAPRISSNIIEIDGSTMSIAINIINNGGAEIKEIGICLSTNPLPTLKDSIRYKQQIKEMVDITVTNLIQDTVYYYMPYATNTAGTTFGSIQSFHTNKNPLIPFNPYLTYGYMNDIDGNTYRTIEIGNQTWMAENLRVTRFRNGDLIPTIFDYKSWISLDTGAQCPYDNSNSKDTIDKYGRYYNWLSTVDYRGLAPAGWHIPTEMEWNELYSYLRKNQYATDGDTLSSMIGKSMASTKGWEYIQAPFSNIGSEQYRNNKSGFTALPSGKKENIIPKSYFIDCYFWCYTLDTTSTFFSAFFALDYTSDQLYSDKEIIKSSGYSIRCIKDK